MIFAISSSDVASYPLRLKARAACFIKARRLSEYCSSMPITTLAQAPEWLRRAGLDLDWRGRGRAFFFRADCLRAGWAIVIFEGQILPKPNYGANLRIANRRQGVEIFAGNYSADAVSDWLETYITGRSIPKSPSRISILKGKVNEASGQGGGGYGGQFGPGA